MSRGCVAALCTVLMAACGGGDSPAATAELAQQESRKLLIAGYQGWFGCPGDFGDNTEWQHWFHGAPSVEAITVDSLPEVSGMADSDLCDTGLMRQDGRPLKVFSSQNANVIDWHFRLMAESGVSAVAFQRFVSAIGPRTDNVLRHAIRSSHRVPFFVSYDVSGTGSDVVERIRADWARVREEVRAGNYLHEDGRPVVMLWGFGFTHTQGEPAEVARLLAELKREAFVIGGVPTNWRTLNGDSKTDQAWSAVYREFDLLSPWTVGRYRDAAGARSFLSVAPNEMPVIFPGFSWSNLMRAYGGSAPANEIPRRCGDFLLEQARLVALSRWVYLAMADEYDEGTAVLPAVPLRGFPAGMTGAPIDANGCALTSDGYLMLTGRIVDAQRASTQPGF